MYRVPAPIHQTGVHAFFFFFSVTGSPDFESDEFRLFCAACYRVRSFKPTLTMKSLQVLLTVAANAEPLSYEAVASAVGQSYQTTAIHAALLSDGRASQPGLGLLRRAPGRNRKEKRLILSRTGRAVARLFAATASGNAPCIGDTERVLCQLKARTLPALEFAVDGAPGINLAAFSVFLFIAQHGCRFGHHGDPASTIANALGASNLTKNLLRLAEGDPEHPGLGLIELRKTRHDRRLILPALTTRGLHLIAHIAATLMDKSPSPLRRPKAEKLQAASSPDEVAKFNDADFDWFDVDGIEWKQD